MNFTIKYLDIDSVAGLTTQFYNSSGSEIDFSKKLAKIQSVPQNMKKVFNLCNMLKHAFMNLNLKIEYIFHLFQSYWKLKEYCQILNIFFL